MAYLFAAWFVVQGVVSIYVSIKSRHENKGWVLGLILGIHQARKKVAVWTVNTEDGLRRAMSMGADAVITDQIKRANTVAEVIRSRSDLDILEDYLYYHLGLD